MLNFFVFLFLQSTLIPVFKFKRSALLDVWKIERTESLLWFCVGVEFMDWIHQDLPKTSLKNYWFFFSICLCIWNSSFSWNFELWTLWTLNFVSYWNWSFLNLRFLTTHLYFDKHAYTYVCVHAVFLQLEYFLVSHR